MGRVAWMVSAALSVAGMVWAWFVLPETGVPMQSDLDGTVDRYGTRTEFIGTHAGLSLLTLVLTPLIGVVAVKGDASFVNMPNKEYWLAPERVEATRADMLDRLWWLLTATNVLMLTTLVEPVLVALGLYRSPSSMGGVVFILFLAFTVWWVARIYRRYRLPDR